MNTSPFHFKYTAIAFDGSEYGVGNSVLQAVRHLSYKYALGGGYFVNEFDNEYCFRVKLIDNKYDISTNNKEAIIIKQWIRYPNKSNKSITRKELYLLVRYDLQKVMSHMSDSDEILYMNTHNFLAGDRDCTWIHYRDYVEAINSMEEAHDQGIM